MNVYILKSTDSECSRFVQQKPNATLEYLPAWSKMIEKTFGYRTFYLVAYEGNAVRGVLPLTEVRSRLFSNRMVSEAFSNYGGPLTECPVACDALCKRAIELAFEYKCKSIEFRNVERMPGDFNLQKDKVTMYIALPADPNELWLTFRKKIRNQVRKAEKSGIVIINGGLELLDDFYNIWTIRMRELGTPCYPRKLFRSILETFPRMAHIFLAQMRGLTVAVAFAYCFNDRVQLRWTAGLIKYNRITPIMLLDWSIMRYYALAGTSLFDFGRCTFGGGTYEFKRRWGSQPIHLNYQYWTPSGQRLSLPTPENPKYSRKVEMWKRLPLWATRLIGPCISCSLP